MVAESVNQTVDGKAQDLASLHCKLKVVLIAPPMHEPDDVQKVVVGCHLQMLPENMRTVGIVYHNTVLSNSVCLLQGMRLIQSGSAPLKLQSTKLF